MKSVGTIVGTVGLVAGLLTATGCKKSDYGSPSERCRNAASKEDKLSNCIALCGQGEKWACDVAEQLKTSDKSRGDGDDSFGSPGWYCRNGSQQDKLANCLSACDKGQKWACEMAATLKPATPAAPTVREIPITSAIADHKIPANLKTATVRCRPITDDELAAIKKNVAGNYFEKMKDKWAYIGELSPLTVENTGSSNPSLAVKAYGADGSEMERPRWDDEIGVDSGKKKRLAFDPGRSTVGLKDGFAAATKEECEQIGSLKLDKH